MMKVKEVMDSHGIESYLPMKYVRQENAKGTPRRAQVPAVCDLIIIKAPEGILDTLKAEHPDALQNLAYRRDYYRDGTYSAPVTVPEREMKLFMDAVIGHEDDLEFLDAKALKGKTGRPVLIISGQFKGVEGTLMRVEGNRHVVIRLKDLVCASLNHIPISSIQFLP